MKKKRCLLFAVLWLSWWSHVTLATVFINEVFINPPGSLDDTREFIELAGTPGKKLDGYAVAILNGTEQKYYPLNSIPPYPVPTPEIDEFFSLDGLTLGANGLLVLAISNRGNYPEALPDCAFRGNWGAAANPIWNGGLDIPGRLQNDGSNTILLVRNRPGRTQADPLNPKGLLWGKSILHDVEVARPVQDPQDGVFKDQWGDGGVDEGTSNGLGGFNLDLVGATTPFDASDDLEVVDEVSYEHERGWEYDTDRRKVDRDSPLNGRPERRVHALDDPQGFNPDALVRVDSRLVGTGWPPATGAIGEMLNGNNWQDTATEQWIRGESTVVIGPMGPELYFHNAPNNNPDAVQPYTTNVPLWLADGIGADYNFSSATTYRMSPGRVNPLAIPYIPGDVDRDGDCDSDDIAKLLSVFGDDDWIFSNAFDQAIESNRGNPADQIRPWDVDQTGDHGIECSDLQWVLNFQGSGDGRVRERTYDSTTPSATGVVLQSNAGVIGSVTLMVSSVQGRPLLQLAVDDQIDIDVLVAVSSGAITEADRQNGVMQVIHDVVISQAGVIRVVGIQPLGSFLLGRPTIMESLGTNGDLGTASIHAYSTSFTQGLSQPASAYRVRMQAVGLGFANVAVQPASEPKFALSTPYGLKVGHTNEHGNPVAAGYPAAVSIGVTELAAVVGDCDGNGLIELLDVGCFTECMEGPLTPRAEECQRVDVNGDGTVDLRDWVGVEILLQTN